MIANSEEVREFFQKTAYNRTDINPGTIIFTNGNENYITTLIKNLLASYKTKTTHKAIISVFCSDEKAYIAAQNLGMTACWVKIPGLGIDEAYQASNAGSDFYLRLCFVKIVLVKYALDLGYDVLYIDPDMSFSKDCMEELLNNSDELSFAKCIYLPNRRVFVNTNLMRVYPTECSKTIFDFVVPRDLPTYLELLPDVSDETFISRRLEKFRDCNAKCLNVREYPAGGDSKDIPPDEIKMYHANCIVGLENKIKYMKENGVWFL
jgi:hypothetical protein